MLENCGNCKYSNHFKEMNVYCSLYDDLVMETDNCGLWVDEDL